MYKDLVINRIVVAVDGSENSKRAGSYAIKLGVELHADVIAVHIVPAGKKFPEENLKRELDMITLISIILPKNLFQPTWTLKLKLLGLNRRLSMK